MSDPVRCDHCGDVIGVYEPLVTVRDGRRLETSLLNSPELGPAGGACWHRECFERRGGGSAARDSPGPAS
jgi:hypothetical protein